jgi:hypothetical protein
MFAQNFDGFATAVGKVMIHLTEKQTNYSAGTRGCKIVGGLPRDFVEVQRCRVVQLLYNTPGLS